MLNDFLRFSNNIIACDIIIVMAECNICNRRCNITEGGIGFCRTRTCKNGQIISLIYGRVAALHVSPIEIKPLYHYYPGSKWLSVGSLGCNFLCDGCQNWQLSHANVKEELKKLTYYIEPQQLIEYAKKQKCIGISFTYNEPTIWFEYTIDAFRLAKECDLLTNYVTNGYINKDILTELNGLLDSFRVDLKGFKKSTYEAIARLSDFELILKNIIKAKHNFGMHVEIITNIIPTYNDDKKELMEMAKWIKNEVGKETPWHITRFFPHYKLKNLLPTPIEDLESIYLLAREAGLEYVYLGNVPGHAYENTYCPKCNNLLIERYNYKVLSNFIINNNCRYCNYKIFGRFN